MDYQGEDFNLRRALRELQDLEHRRSGRLTGDVVDHCFRTDRDDPTAHFQAALEGLAPMDRERVDAALIAAAPDGADTGALFGTAREVASTWRRDAHEREFPQARRDREAREAAAAAAD